MKPDLPLRTEDASQWQAEDVISRGYKHDPGFVARLAETRPVDESGRSRRPAYPADAGLLTVSLREGSFACVALPTAGAGCLTERAHRCLRRNQMPRPPWRARPLAAGGVIDFELMELHPLGAFEALLAGGPPT